MNCQQARPLINPYADGELEAAGVLDLEKHIHDCPACALALRNAQSLKKALKQDSLFSAAPAELRRRIKAELHSQIKTEPWWNFWNWNWLTAASTGMAAVCLALLLTVTMTRPSAQQRLTREIVSSHVRSLMPNHLLDVVSTDQHTVKPWFNGKVDFSPPIKDLAAQEFPLAGGRLDYLDGRSVAALVFQHRKHVINLFIWPAKEADSNPAPLTPIQGYHLIHWSDSGMTFWAVSDLNEKELMEFVQDFAAGKTLNP
ncbi:MAG: zinc-finger family protein [Pedosphaera sp.]|nr:zinc-finger family protein [Pedosphaera sp.]